MVCDKLTRQTHTQKTHYHRGLGEQDSGMPIDCKEHTLTLTPTTSNLGTPNHTTLRAFGLGEETGEELPSLGRHSYLSLKVAPINEILRKFLEF